MLRTQCRVQHVTGDGRMRIIVYLMVRLDLHHTALTLGVGYATSLDCRWRSSNQLRKPRLIPYWCKDPAGGRKPINAKCETVGSLPTFRDAYRLRRCILPVDGFYEGQRPKQPYAIAMKDGSPFGIAALWENWKDPQSGEWIKTFAVITTDANRVSGRHP
jgi:hypothetical protein